MKQILKRLELIKTAITLEEEEIIELQVSKLADLDINEDVRRILVDIHNHQYGKIAVSIDEYINKFSGLVNYQDKEVEGLRLELKTVEHILQGLSETKNEFLNEIMDFNTQYHLRLGDIIQDILKLRKKILEKLAQRSEKNQTGAESSKTKTDYEEAKKDYEEFSNEYKETKLTNVDVRKISDEDQKELKKLYRKGVKLCHPDITTDKLKEQAHEIMQSLNKAYYNKDLDGVREIVNALEAGTSFTIASDSIDDKELLKAKIDEFREKIDLLEKDIIALKEDDVYQIIVGFTSIDEYFDEISVELKEEHKDLKNRLDELEVQDLSVETEFDYHESLVEHEESVLSDLDDDFWKSEF